MSDFLFFTSLFLVAYVYAGYPLLLALAARLRPDAPSLSEYLPTVTLLITAYNEADVIAVGTGNFYQAGIITF